MASDDRVTCCCCGKSGTFDDVFDQWHPQVFHGDTPLGSLCVECAREVGLRDSLPGEMPHNERIVDFDAFRRVRCHTLRYVVVATDADGNEYEEGLYVTRAEAEDAADGVLAEGEEARIVEIRPDNN